MEWLIHVDEDDTELGAVLREEAHRRGLLHRAGCVFLVDSRQRVCVVTRAPTKRLFGGRRDTACSFHVSHGESYEEAARRELFEETGVRAPLEEVGVVRVEHPLDRMLVAVYVARWERDPELDPEEAVSPRWCVFDEVDAWVRDPGGVTPWVRVAWPEVRAHLEGGGR